VFVESAISHTETQCTFTVSYWTENQFSFGDTQTLNLGGAIGGSITFNNSQGGSPVNRGTRTYVYTYDNNDYGRSPGTRTFSATLSGAYNGITPSKSRTENITARPYGLPAGTTSATASRINDESNKVSWVNHPTVGEPYSNVGIDRYIDSYFSYGGQDWTKIADVGGTANSYSDAGAIPNRKWKYRTYSKNSIGNSGYDYTEWLWTSPATPTACARTTSGSNEVVTWTGHMAYSEHGTEVWHAANGVWDSSPLATVGSAVDTYIHTAPSASIKHKYKVRAKTTSGTVLYSSFSGETTETAGTVGPPNAPINLSPSGSTVLDPGLSIPLIWTHNPTDGTAQTAYMVQYREVGTLTWTQTAKIVTSSSNYYLSPGTFLNSKTIEWQVMTWGTSPTGSPFSASAVFVTQDAIPKKYPLFLDVTSGQIEANSTPILVPVATRYRTTTFNIASNTWTVIPFDAEADPMVGISYASNGEFTIGEDGVYIATVTVGFVASTAGYQRTSGVFLNGACIGQVNAPPGTAGSGNPSMNCTVIFTAMAGDKVTGNAWQNTGTTLAVYGTTARNITNFSLVKVVPALNGSGGGGGGGSGGAPSGAAGGELAGSYPNPVIANAVLDEGNFVAANLDGIAATPSLRTLGTGAQQATAGNDARLSNTRTPTAHASTHQPGGSDAMSVDAVAATGSLRTLGTGAQQAASGTDSRLSDARTPTAHVHAATDVNSGVLDLARLGTTPAAGEYLKSGGATGPADWVPITTIKSDLALTKSDVGLANVDNTTDAAKPVSTATQTALNLKIDTTQKAAASGVASLDGSVKVPIAQLPTGSTSTTVTVGNDARLSDSRAPTAHATSHQPGGSDVMSVDAVAATGSLRTLGTGAQQAASGTDSRFTNARTPTTHATSHQPGGSDAMAVDAVAATGSLRTLGTGAQQAAVGSHTHAGLAPALNIKDEGTLITAAPAGLNFVGEGVTVAGTPEPTITIPGAPTGAIMMWPTATPPTGWLICDGSAIPGGNTALIALIGANTPDMRDAAPVGASATKTVNTTGGSATKTLTATNLPSHVHQMTHSHTAGTLSVSGRTTGPGSQGNVHAQASGAGAITEAAANGNTGGSSATDTFGGPGTSAPFDVMNPYRALTFIIKT
jgi:microcystin-dependent protein